MSHERNEPGADKRRKQGPLAVLVDPDRHVGRLTFVLIAAGIVALDQATKWLAVAYLKQGPPIVLVPNYLLLRYETNTGAAFSILHGHVEYLAILSAVVAVFLAIWGWRLKDSELGLRIPLGLLLGGAIGNLIDRAFLRYVIDFIVAHWQHKAEWPTFNVADSAICVGMALLILGSLLAGSNEARNENQPAATGANDARPDAG